MPDAPIPTNSGPSEAFKKFTQENEEQSNKIYDENKIDKGVDLGEFLSIPRHLLPVAGVATTAAVAYGVRSLMNRNKNDNTPPETPPNTPPAVEVDEAKYAKPNPFQQTEPVDKVAEAQAKLADIQAAKGQGTPNYNVPTGAPSIGSQMPSNMGISPQGTPSAVPPNTLIPNAPVDTAANMVAGETPTQAAVTTTDQKTAEVASKVKQKKTELIGPPQPVPPGMRPVPPTASQNVGPGETIGVGGYTNAYNTYGEETPRLWSQAIGEKNLGYPEAPNRIRAFHGSEIMGGEPGKFTETPIERLIPPGHAGRPKFAPGYINGAADPRALAVTAALATVPSLASAGYQAYQGNKEAVHAHLQDAWDALKSTATLPYDVSKSAVHGDFGPLKDFLMSMNPATALVNEVSKSDQEKINKMIYKEKVGGGRGLVNPKAVAPY